MTGDDRRKLQATKAIEVLENGDYGGEQKAETLKSQPKELGDIT